jgi:hypothetical protein
LYDTNFVAFPADISFLFGDFVEELGIEKGMLAMLRIAEIRILNIFQAEILCNATNEIFHFEVPRA